MILYGLGDGWFILGPSYSTGKKSEPISMAVGDFDGDGRVDITTVNYLMNNIGIYISYGSTRFGGITTYSTGFESEPYSVAISDFNNDKRSDVVVANYGTNNTGIFLGYDYGTFASMVTYSTGDYSHPNAVTVDELNNDNRSDIVVTNSETNNLYIFLGHGDGTFSLVTIYLTGFLSRPYGITIGDFDNDHTSDIISVNAGTGKVLLLHGYGDGTLGNEITYPTGYNFRPYAVAVADFKWR